MHLTFATLTLIQLIANDTGQEEKLFWYKQCSLGTFSCFGYVQGIYETTRYLAGQNGTKTICAPDNFKAPEFAEYMVKTMNETGNEEMQSLSFSGLVIAALESEYPCK